MAVHPDGTRCLYNWDGAALNGATEAYVILHEIAHFALAPPERRGLIDFGLGPGPDTKDRDAAESAAVVSSLAREKDEAAASLLGIVWEAELSQPALASFLDQNWLEGLGRSAGSHFTAVLGTLRGADCSASRRPANPIKRRPVDVAEPVEPQPQSAAVRRIPRPGFRTDAPGWRRSADLRDPPAFGLASDRLVAYACQAPLQIFHRSPRSEPT